ncbi:conserved hypothetical protein [Planktothrix serta PCC 8927]|uniref:Uncharacterized protein n=1 Tax=Planktothrix serta PCC 8927 TaxID=671068 RepID=A0A7Z9BPN7_9CYAN|nr:hypothetical protein [Planktothrix serta]VXD17616.1 conserved hypothetical protein [Planktothrix serta PCC 8927]
MSAFVGTKEHLEVIQLQEMIKSLFPEPAYFCERKPDKIEPFKLEPFKPGFPQDFAPEGQIFNQQRELRWKKTRKGFSVLLLSLDEPQTHTLNKLKNNWKTEDLNWKTEDRNAHIYRQSETRFPKGVHALSAEIDQNNFPLGQRYFQDADTATIHFIALTLIKPL